MDCEDVHKEHDSRLTNLETHQTHQALAIADIAATMKTICASLTLLVVNTSEVVQIMQTARGIKLIVVWVSPFVVLVGAIIGIVKYFS